MVVQILDERSEEEKPKITCDACGAPAVIAVIQLGISGNYVRTIALNCLACDKLIPIGHVYGDITGEDK